MCGIAGWIERDCLMTERRGRLQAMSQTLERRGPDENGMYLNGDTALIHRRLVVIDRENGKQPMAARHGGATYVIVYNGELYNTEELREELRSKGFRGGAEGIHSVRRALPRKAQRDFRVRGVQYARQDALSLPRQNRC